MRQKAVVIADIQLGECIKTIRMDDDIVMALEPELDTATRAFLEIDMRHGA